MKNFKFSLLFGVPALLVFGWGALQYYRCDWRPVYTPIPALGSTVSAEFTADMTGGYVVMIEFNADKDRDYWECVFGCDVSPDKCKGVSDSASVAWKIAAGPKTVSEGIAERPGRCGSWYWGQGLNSMVTHYYSAEAGKTYRVEVMLKGPDATIERVKPFLKVTPSMRVHKNAVVTFELFQTAAILLAIPAAISFIWEFVVFVRNRRRSLER